MVFSEWCVGWGGGGGGGGGKGREGQGGGARRGGDGGCGERPGVFNQVVINWINSWRELGVLEVDE